MKRLWTLIRNGIEAIVCIVVILVSCAIYGLWEDPFGDNDGGGWG